MSTLTNAVAETKERSGWTRRRPLRLLGALLAFVGLLLVAGAAYQAIASTVDARHYPPPGQMVDVGGYRLHLNVVGQAGEGPTVILENGGAGFTPQWGWVQPAVAEFSRVVAYDRPGTGWSEASPEPLEAAEVAAALHLALEKSGISGPYVLAGHSMGGLMARTFARLYPDEVVGIVLVDPRPPSLGAVFPDGGGEVNLSYFRLLGLLNRLGVSRLMGAAESQAKGLPPGAYEQAVALSYSDHHVRGMVAEGFTSNSLGHLLTDGDTLGERPLIVLSAGEVDASFDEQARPRLTAVQQDMASLSSHGEHRLVPGASHHTIVTQQQYAQAVVDAIYDVVVSSSAKE